MPAVSLMLLNAATGASGEGHNAGVIIIDMGTHVLSRMSGSHLIVQAVVPGLEERAFNLVQPTSLSLQPGEMLHMHKSPGHRTWLCLASTMSNSKRTMLHESAVVLGAVLLRLSEGCIRQRAALGRCVISETSEG